jgi:hypothetical protein
MTEKNIMPDFLLILLVGWPAVVMAVILAITGLLSRDYRFLVVVLADNP